MATLNDFTEIRELILKNAIYNRILIARLSKAPTFQVASTLLILRNETKEELKKDVHKNRLPTYALYNIIVKFNNYTNFSVGVEFPNHTVIWDYPNVTLKSYKELANFIYSKYSINPAKSDKIFSAINYDTKMFLVSNDYSYRFWYQGFSKKNRKIGKIEFDIAKVEEYLGILIRRNIEYRAFNTILLNLLKYGRYYSKKVGFGFIDISRSIFEKKVFIKFDSELDFKTYSDVFPISVFSPTLWNTYESDIDKYVLVTITD